MVSPDEDVELFVNSFNDYCGTILDRVTPYKASRRLAAPKIVMQFYCILSDITWWFIYG